MQIEFSVGAKAARLIGRENIADVDGALVELIKNAYDADATHADLIFENAYYPGGSLRLIDNGHGMSRDQLINGFMRLSSSDKLHNPVSPTYRRLRAGQKGIGRFATQRLGQKLTIITQTESEEFASMV